ncbi:tetratricopeptide repeat-containing sensor histidine kinase [Lacinutrix sp. 5H-3-7-4]|uniref:tetratricopeptide repeat-containing sensor histidine kinase n=1 Tax=Lacinutrix sp. (strain 5H-3-7-4) TaxID=983544 RepID=UPI00020A3CFD|nr:tetratricopeptide repeat-containing sensor histidine kinase [Lacinutrix sp. 5H-3-7-4]AEH01946.1 putative signal transduction histidine kinase [Lacinutrix sp. 5H-3-7-4]
MKILKKTSLLLCVFSIYTALVFAQSTKVKQDSIKYYYSVSRSSKFEVPKRLTAVSNALKLLKKDTTSSLYLKTINQKSYLFNKANQLDSALVFAKILLNKSIAQQDIKMQKLALRKLANYNRSNFNFIRSYNYNIQLKNISLKSKDTLEVVKALQHISSLQNIIGLPFESEASAVECLKLLDALKDTPKIIISKIGIYNQLGIIYKNLKNYERALSLYDKALSKTENATYISTLLNNKANVYRDQKKYAKAEIILKQVYKKALEINKPSVKNRALDNLGFVQSKLNNPRGEQNLKQALKARELNEDLYGIYTSCMHLAEHFIYNNNLIKARAYAHRAYNIAVKLKSNTNTLDALALLSKTSTDAFVTNFIHLKDSIQNANLKTRNKYASVKYDYAKQELLAKENELEKEKEKRLKFIYLAGIFLVLITSTFLYFLLRAKHKKNNLKQVFLTEARISKKVHDEVANDVYHVMTKLQSDNMINISVLDDLESIYTKTRDISRENNAINTTGNFEEALIDLLLSYQSSNVNVITKNLSKINWSQFSNLKKMTIYRVLQELMVNMKKHSQASLVVLSFEKTKEKLIIKYNDNGIGTTFKKANGLQNVENRIVTIKGTITFDTEVNKGFKAIIKV